MLKKGISYEVNVQDITFDTTGSYGSKTKE